MREAARLRCGAVHDRGQPGQGGSDRARPSAAGGGSRYARPSGRSRRTPPDAVRLRRASQAHGDRRRLLAARGGVLPLCARIVGADGSPSALSAQTRAELASAVDRYAAGGLRVLAVAERDMAEEPLQDWNVAELDLALLGLVALVDPPRPQVAAAVAAAHRAGIRIHVITSDSGPTAAQIARQVGLPGRRSSRAPKWTRWATPSWIASSQSRTRSSSRGPRPTVNSGSARRCGQSDR